MAIEHWDNAGTYDLAPEAGFALIERAERLLAQSCLAAESDDYCAEDGYPDLKHEYDDLKYIMSGDVDDWEMPIVKTHCENIEKNPLYQSTCYRPVELAPEPEVM